MKESDFQTVSIKAARKLTTTTKTGPMYITQSPKLLLKLLPWEDVPGGTFRVNRTKIIIRGRGRITIEFEDGVPVLSPNGLREIPLFTELKPKLLSEMVSKFKIEHYERGTVVITEGEDGDKLFILATGNAELVKKGTYGEELRLRIIGSGDFVGETEVAGDVQAEATERTLTDCLFLTLSKADLFSILNADVVLKTDFNLKIDRAIELQHMADEFGERKLDIAAGHIGVPKLPLTYVDYIEEPVEIPINLIQAVLRVHTRVSDLYNDPMNQLQMQMKIMMANMYEKQEWMLINDLNFGLLAKCDPSMRIQPRYGPPTPDDLDALLSLVWKQPSFFLAHPRTIAAFGRECTWRGVPPLYEEIAGQKVINWRGVPLIPSDKMEIDGHTLSRFGPGKSNVLLIRTGGQDVQGVVGLYRTGIPGEIAPSFSIRQMSIDNQAIASYLMTLYFSLAILTEDAVATLENVEVGYYHDYASRKPKKK